MANPQHFGDLAALAGLAPDHPLARVAEEEHARLMRRLGGQASEREAWLVMLCVQRAVELCLRTRRAAVTGMIDAIALHEAAHAITVLCEQGSTALRSVAVNSRHRR